MERKKERKRRFLSSILSICLMMTMVLSAVSVAGVTVHAETHPWGNDLSKVDGNDYTIAEKHAFWQNGHQRSSFLIGTDDPVFGVFKLDSNHEFTELKKDVDYKVIYIGRVFNHVNTDVTNSFDNNLPGAYTFKIEGINNYTGVAVLEPFYLEDPSNPDPAYNYTGTPGDTTVYPTAPYGTTIKKLSKLKKGFKVTWNKTYAGNANGYQIRYSLKSSMAKAKTVTVKSVSTSSKKITKLKAKKKYYVQIRTYKTVGGTKYYSEWSEKKSVKTK